jgi:hypothetical protein
MIKNEGTQSIYNNLLKDYTLKFEKTKIKARTISFLRLAVFVGAAFLIYLFASSGLMTYLYIIIFLGIIAFLVLIKMHSKVLYQQKIQEAFIKINKDELKALSGDFGHFENGKNFIDHSHSFSYDIDIFGEASLFQFLNRTATSIGKLKLVDRLKNPFLDIGKIQKNQQAVNEIKEKLNWRQNFQAIALSEKENESDKKRILDWVKRPVSFHNPIFKILIVIIPILTILMLVLFSIDIIDEKQLLLYFLLPLGISGSFSKKVNKKHMEVSRTSAMLSKYGKLLNEIEMADFSSEIISGFKESLKTDGATSSLEIKKLSSILNALDNRLNFVSWVLFNGFMLWDILQMLRLERWQTKHNDKLENWFDVIAETEVLNSLANFSYNNPDAEFPKLQSSGFIFQAEKLGHPLIPKTERVDNEVKIKSTGFSIITGANMAGKSTYLRTIGVNLILGMIGAPVSGKGVTLNPIRLYTSIRTDDSLQKNESYFYSELKRLKFIIDELKKGTKLFIILDEILRGTNSKDKHAGSEALLKQLIDLKTAGIIATHDVALGILEESFPDHIRNSCFEVDIDGSELSFDYKLRDGVSKNMNATILMREMGITV